jgi:predicted nuclease of predicted toxin-antitoxin system
MRFLVDAQLPRRVSDGLRERGHESLHTLDLPEANRTPDLIINELSIAERRLVVTKDADFVDSLIVQGVPYKLLLVSTGNVKNSELEALLFRNLDAIVLGFESHVFIEIDRGALRFHF